MIAGVLEIQMMANMARLSDDMRRAERVVGDSMTKVERSVANAKRALSNLGMGVSIGLLADQMRRTVDAYTKLDAQIRLSTKSQQSYNQALADIRRISTVAQADISATTMLYTRLINTTEGMGISQAKLATVTETVSYGLKAYGATSSEAASAALQLSQAMGANRLGGEEFRAVMEAMPNVMKVLAKSMGVPLGELRALSIAGKITTAEMVKAFGDPAVAAEFKKMAERAQTVTGAWTVARNEFMLLFGEFAKSSGLTQGMIATFNGLAGALRTTAQYIGDIIVLLGAWAALRVTQMVYGYVAALMAQRAAAVAVAQAELARVNMTYGASAATVAAARSSYAYAAANATLGGSFMILGQRMAAFVSANAAVIAIGALGVAAVALKRDFDDAIDSVGKFQEKIRGMELDALRSARQLEVANVAAMKSSIFSGFKERDILFAERRIRMMDAQIAAAEKLAEAEKKIPPVPAAGAGGTAPKDRTTIFERMTNEMRAANEADLYGKLDNVDKVKLAWANLNDQQKKDAKHLSDYKTALIEAELTDERVKREAMINGISESIMRAAKSGNFGKAIRDDIQAAFEKEVIMPQVKVMVSAGIDWVKALMANTLAIKEQSAKDTTDKGSTWGWIILIVAAIFDLVRTVKTADFIRATATRGGVSGVRGSRFEQGRGWGGGVNVSETFGTLGTLTSNKLNAAVQDITATYARAGDVLGYANTRTKDFNVSIETSGDVVGALSGAIGASLLPSLRMFQREGETLQQTAERLTNTFKATNDFIVALGVSQGAAFGGYGLGSVAGRDALIAASGGLQAFTQNAQSFVRNFLTPAEQMAPALDEVGRTFARLGIQGVSTNEQFAALVKEQMALGNTDVVAQLLSVSDSFAQITKSAADANKELQALLKREAFSTLVDYIRATNAGVSAAGSIAGAVSAAEVVLAQEAAGTAALTDTFTEPVMPEDLSRTGGSVFSELIRSFLEDLGAGLKKLFAAVFDPKAPFKLADKIFSEWRMALNAIRSKFNAEALNPILRAMRSLIPSANQLRTVLNLLRSPVTIVRSALNALVAPLRRLASILRNLPGAGGGGIGGIPLPPLPFANGGVFTNGIYNRPTPFMFANGAGFSAGVMAEAGDEAVMPLTRGADGRLGVSLYQGGGEATAELRALREQVSMMLSAAANTSVAAQRTYKLLDRWEGLGMPEVREAV